jgi:hypothetical protein
MSASLSNDSYKHWVMNSSRAVAVNQGLRGAALEEHMRQVEKSIYAQKANTKAERQSLEIHDRLSGPPPALAPKYMSAPQNFQKQLLGYLMYQVGADRPANRGKDDTLQVHNCEQAIHDLRDGIAGFWVAAPTMWGVEQIVLNKYTTSTGVDLTHNDHQDPTEVLTTPTYAMVTMVSSQTA